MRTVTRLFLVLALVVIVGLYALSHPLQDFVEYWTAGHLFVARMNPYSLTEMFQAQRALGWPEPVPEMVLSPPWILPLIAPLGLLKSYSAAWLLWVAVLSALLMLSTRLLLSVYDRGGTVLRSESSTSRCLLGFTFYPALVCLKFAQVGPLLLLGIAGFLWFDDRKRPVWAGISLALAAIKPQLLYLFWLALLLHSVRQKKWKELVSVSAMLGLLTGIALLIDRRAMFEYWQLSTTPYVKLFPSALGALLRRLPGAREMFWLQFVPTVVGVVCLAIQWRRFRDNWHWAEQMPFLVTLTVLSAPYGWTFDEVVLVVPIVALAARYAKNCGGFPRTVVFVFTVLNIALIFFLMLRSPIAFVMAPVLVMLFLCTNEMSLLQPTKTARPDSAVTV
jgi:glycosyl transferase family 87